MHNGFSSSGSVLEIKEHAKSVAERSKGFSAKALIGSARSQMQLAQSRDAARDPKAALHALYIAANLFTIYMSHSSYAADRTKGSPIHNEFLQFYQVRTMSSV
jgi:ubiquitin carboxyl-terminal hydrolase 8